MNCNFILTAPGLITCPPVTLTGGSFVINGKQVGSTVVYKCDAKFHLVGSNIRKCNIEGSWTGEAPRCQGI